MKLRQNNVKLPLDYDKYSIDWFERKYPLKLGEKKLSVFKVYDNQEFRETITRDMFDDMENIKYYQDEVIRRKNMRL